MALSLRQVALLAKVIGKQFLNQRAEGAVIACRALFSGRLKCRFHADQDLSASFGFIVHKRMYITVIDSRL